MAVGSDIAARMLVGPRLRLHKRGGASPNRMIDKVPLNPRHDQIGKSVYLRFGEFTAFGQMMPFFDASAAACGGSMLSGEYRMAAPWRLSAVVLRFGCAYAVSQHFSRMTIDGRLAFGGGHRLGLCRSKRIWRGTANETAAPASRQSIVARHRCYQYPPSPCPYVPQ